MNNQMVGGRRRGTAAGAWCLLVTLAGAMLLCAGCSSGARVEGRGVGGQPEAVRGMTAGIRSQGVPIFATPRIVAKGETIEIEVTVTGEVAPENLPDYEVGYKNLIGSADKILEDLGGIELTIAGTGGGHTFITVKIDSLTGDWEVPNNVVAVEVTFGLKNDSNVISTVVTVTDAPIVAANNFAEGRRDQRAARSVAPAPVQKPAPERPRPRRWEILSQGVPIFGTSAEVKAGMNVSASVLTDGPVAGAVYQAKFLDGQPNADYFEDPVVTNDPFWATDQFMVHFKGKSDAPKQNQVLKYKVWRSHPTTNQPAIEGELRVEP